MHLLPRFTATSALAPFGIVGIPHPSVGTAAWGAAKSCNNIALASCEHSVLIDFEYCRRRVTSACWAAGCSLGNTNDPYCQSCLAREGAACTTANADGLRACSDQYGCPSGAGWCRPDLARPVGDPIGTCCPPDQIACAGNCLPPCDAAHVFNLSNCSCDCPLTLCPLHKPLNPATCRCECPATPCPDYRMTRDPKSCQCRCPEGLYDCGGYCADLKTDELFCGSCDAEPCDAFEELCCDGTCTNICSDANCGSCGRAIQLGEKCCHPQCTPTKLGTDTNCSDCGDNCISKNGRNCVSGTCRCPSGTRDCCANPPCINSCCPNGRECCNGVCCPTGMACCNNSCISTYWDDAHCGGCNQPCPTDRTCINGVCECQADLKDCGGQCIPLNTLCCLNIPCSVTATDCCSGCRDLFTVPAVPGWSLWRAANPNAKWGICVNGVVECNPPVVSLTATNGVSLCCPPGSTAIDQNGLCT